MSFIDFEFDISDNSKEKFAQIDDALRMHLRAAMAQIGKETRDVARGLVPRRTGALGKSIRARFVEAGDTLTETVRPTKFYGKFLEHGVVRHGTQSNKAVGVGLAMSVKRAKVQRVRDLRQLGQWRIEPRPFMGPALHAMESRIREVISDALADAVLEVDEGAT